LVSFFDWFGDFDVVIVWCMLEGLVCWVFVIGLLDELSVICYDIEVIVGSG